MLSNEAMQLIHATFTSQNVNFPAALAPYVCEVRDWAESASSAVEIPPAPIGLVEPSSDAS